MISQSGRASPGSGRKRRWREIGDGSVLLAPGGGGQFDMRVPQRVGLGDDIGDDDEGAGRERRLDKARFGHGDGRVRAHDPDGLDAPVGDGAKHFDRLQARPLGDGGGAPEAAHAVAMRRVLDLHMRGEHIGEAADLAPAHGVRLTGDRERPHARPADPSRREMAIDDRIDLVGAGGGLIDALAIDGHDFLGSRKERIESL